MKIPLALVSNRRTTGAGAVFILAKLGAHVGALWLPAHANQFRATADAVESAAVALGFLAAGDASAGVSRTEADTEFVRKTDLPVTVDGSKGKP